MNIMKAVKFEGFLQKKYASEKRFGLEGCESFIPAMMQCLETSAEKGDDFSLSLSSSESKEKLSFILFNFYIYIR